jgi:hypothetical protein
MKKIYFILSFYLLIYCTSCNLFECENNVAGLHDFELPATLTPALDTFRIGDTMRISSIFGNQIFEKKLQKTFTLDGWSFFPYTAISKLDTSIVLDDALINFDIIVDSKYDYSLFYYSDGGVNLVGEYSYENDTYHLEYALIPKKAGLFLLLHASALVSFGSEQEFPGKCKGQESRASVAMNGGGDNNIDFLAHTPDTSFYQITMEDLQLRYYGSGSYCFYVVE